MRFVRPMLLAVGIVFAGFAAHAADDDGIMGYWEGKYTSGDPSGKPVAMELVARGKSRWVVNVLSGDDKARLKGEMEVNKTEEGPEGKKVARYALKGTVQLGDAAAATSVLGGSIENGVLKGGITSSGKKPIELELKRVKLVSPSFNAAPPSGAKVLFDGKNLDGWIRVPEKWALLEEEAMQVASGVLKTTEDFGSFKLHLEFRCPFMPSDLGQERGNSGVYIHGCYEVQVLDSFGLPPADNDCGGIYSQAVPSVCASYPPLTWQTYDIEFHAPKFDASGKKTDDAVITVVHNGTTIHDKRKLTASTPGGLRDSEAPTGPIMLQDHRNAVRYRNIWLEPLKD
jgi:hypothetical protein